MKRSYIFKEVMFALYGITGKQESAKIHECNLNGHFYGIPSHGTTIESFKSWLAS